jgi:hypothetical protein
MCHTARFRVVAIAVALAAVCEFGGLVGACTAITVGVVAICVSSRREVGNAAVSATVPAATNYWNWILATLSFGIAALLFSIVTPMPGIAFAFGLVVCSPLFGTVTVFINSALPGGS